MPTAREARPSEKTFNAIHMEMSHLNVCVWYPLKEDAFEHIRSIRRSLNQLEDQLEEESKNQKG